MTKKSQPRASEGAVRPNRPWTPESARPSTEHRVDGFMGALSRFRLRYRLDDANEAVLDDDDLQNLRALDTGRPPPDLES